MCYLCGQVVRVDATGDDAWDRDHVPPKSFFGSSLRKKLGLDLNWLFTHKKCNRSYKGDEEYFVASIPTLMPHFRTATAVLDDFARGVRTGESATLHRRVLSQFGKVHAPNGMIPVYLERDRLERVLWKLVRGCFFQQSGRVLPETVRAVPMQIVLPPTAHDVLPAHPWFSLVRDTDSLSHVGEVFDVKAIGYLDEGVRAHVFALLIWDGLIAMTAFHDPTCNCELGCKADRVEGRGCA